MSQIKFNLALARVPSTPSDFFIQSANQCNLNELNIQNGDVYGDYSATTANDSWLRKFELEVAHYFGKEAAIFLPSGVMAQNIALKISQKGDTSRTKFVCHHTSHLLIHEQAAYQELLQMSPYVVGQANAKVLNLPPLLYEDVKPLLEKQGVEKPTTVIVEVPHRGMYIYIYIYTCTLHIYNQ